MILISVLFGGAVYAEDSDVDVLVLDSNGLPVNTAQVGDQLTITINASSGDWLIYNPLVLMRHTPGTTLNINPYNTWMTNDGVNWIPNIPGTEQEFFYYSDTEEVWVWEPDFLDEDEGWEPLDWANLIVDAEVTSANTPGNVTEVDVVFLDDYDGEPYIIDYDSYPFITEAAPTPHNDTNTTNRTYNGTCCKPCCTPTCGAMVSMQPTGLEAVMGAFALLLILGGSILTRY